MAAASSNLARGRKPRTQVTNPVKSRVDIMADRDFMRYNEQPVYEDDDKIGYGPDGVERWGRTPEQVRRTFSRRGIVIRDIQRRWFSDSYITLAAARRP